MRSRCQVMEVARLEWRNECLILRFPQDISCLLIEGIFSYGAEKSPFDKNDNRNPGWNLGRQIVCQYGIEVALKLELAKYQDSVHLHHNFKTLFRMLPKERRDKAEKMYRAVMQHRVPWTWGCV